MCVSGVDGRYAFGRKRRGGGATMRVEEVPKNRSARLVLQLFSRESDASAARRKTRKNVRVRKPILRKTFTNSFRTRRRVMLCAIPAGTPFRRTVGAPVWLRKINSHPTERLQRTYTRTSRRQYSVIRPVNASAFRTFSYASRELFAFGSYRVSVTNIRISFRRYTWLIIFVSKRLVVSKRELQESVQPVFSIANHDRNRLFVRMSDR